MQNDKSRSSFNKPNKYKTVYLHVNWRELGTEVLRRRIELGFTIAAISVLTGLSDAWLSRLELGNDGNVEINRLLLLCSELDINIREDRYWELREDKPSIPGLKDYRE